MKTYPDSGTAEAERAASGDGFECRKCYASVKELSDSGNCEACELALADDRVADMLAVIAGPHEPERVELKDGNDVAIFAHMQSGMGFRPDFPQFNLIVHVGEHTEGCTVGVETLAGYGYAPPTIPAADRYANRSVDDNGEFLAN